MSRIGWINWSMFSEESNSRQKTKALKEASHTLSPLSPLIKPTEVPWSTGVGGAPHTKTKAANYVPLAALHCTEPPATGTADVVGSDNHSSKGTLYRQKLWTPGPLAFCSTCQQRPSRNIPSHLEQGANRQIYAANPGARQQPCLQRRLQTRRKRPILVS